MIDCSPVWPRPIEAAMAPDREAIRSVDQQMSTHADSVARARRSQSRFAGACGSIIPRVVWLQMSVFGMGDARDHASGTHF